MGFQLISVSSATSDRRPLWQIYEDRRNAGDLWLVSADAASPIGEHKGPDHERYPIWSDAMREAVHAARSARFDGRD